MTECVERFRVVNTPVDAVSMKGVLRLVDDYVKKEGHRKYILAVNPEKVYALRRDPSLREWFEKATLLIPDGIGIVLALRLLFGKHVGRVAGADLMQGICAAAPGKGYRIFIYGAKEDVNQQAVATLRERCPGIQIVGRANGYVPEQDMGGVIAEINAAKTEILFVALGSPMQEEWIATHLEHLDIKVCQGIGGTLDVIVGKARRAPWFMRRIGLEWLYRLVSDPRRWRRQAVLPLFVLEVLWQWIRGQGRG